MKRTHCRMKTIPVSHLDKHGMSQDSTITVTEEHSHYTVGTILASRIRIMFHIPTQLRQNRIKLKPF